MSRKRTITYFDYGGYYSKSRDDVHWIAREDVIYYVMIKTSEKDVTFANLVQEIRKKILVDENESTTKLKLSFISLVNSCKRSLYIRNDEDVYFYLLSEVEGKNVLYVVTIEEEGRQNMHGEHRKEAPPESNSFDQQSYISVANNDPISSDGAYGIGSTKVGECVHAEIEGDIHAETEDIHAETKEGIDAETEEAIDAETKELLMQKLKIVLMQKMVMLIPSVFSKRLNM